jgi:hypothetical protein
LLNLTQSVIFIVTFLFHEVPLSLGYNMANSKGDDREKKPVDKSPVHARVIPTMDIESGKESQAIEKDPKELRGALHAMKEVPPNEADKIEEMKKITVVTDGKTISDKQDETTRPKSQDKEKETLEVRSTMPTESEVGKQGLDVQEIYANKEVPNVDRLELPDPATTDYVYPFTFAMAIWQDFALSAVNTYNEFAREFSKLHSNWMNIFLNVWQSSDHEKKDEDK